MSLSRDNQGEAGLKALLLSDLVRSTHLVEDIGDRSTAQLFARHDTLARRLLEEYNGLEIDKADGFLLLFEHPLEAIRYALAYHEALEQLAREMKTDLAARVGIHFGEVFLRSNPPEFVERGAKPLEVEGLAKPITARVTSLAGPRQTLLTRGAFEIGQRAAVDRTLLTEGVTWMSHGAYRLQGLRMPLRIFEVGVEGFAPLAPPGDSTKVHPATGEMTTPVRTSTSTPWEVRSLYPPPSDDLPALVTQVVETMEASRRPRRRFAWLAAALLFAAGLAFQEYRIAVLRANLEQANERALAAERREETANRILEVVVQNPGDTPARGEDPKR